GQEDPSYLAQLARGRLRDKIADLERALTGRVRPVHRTLLKLHLEHIDDLNTKIASLSEEIDRLLVPFDTTDALERLAAIPAGQRKDTYLGTQYARLAARRGKKRAAVAVAQSILIIVYHMLKRGTSYRDLGADYFDKRNEQQIQRSLVKRLERLGLKVTVESA